MSSNRSKSISILQCIIQYTAYNQNNQNIQIIQTILKKIALIEFKDMAIFDNLCLDFQSQCAQYISSNRDQKQTLQNGKKILIYLGEMFISKNFAQLSQLESEFISVINILRKDFKLLEPNISMICPDQNMSKHEMTIEYFLDNINEEQVDKAKLKKISQQVNEYLETIKSYRAEINYLSNMMKIPMPESIVEKNQHNQYTITASLEFQCIYLNKKMMFFQASGQDSYYQGCLEKVYKQILYQVYTEIFQLWKDFKKLKKKKMIIC